MGRGGFVGRLLRRIRGVLFRWGVVGGLLEGELVEDGMIWVCLLAGWLGGGYYFAGRETDRRWGVGLGIGYVRIAAQGLSDICWPWSTACTF